MKVVVISLRSSKRRRETVSRQLRAIGVPFQFFDAVDGRGARAHIHHFDGSEFFLNTGRAAAANEIACYASHLAVWRQSIDENEPIVVLEDDVRLGMAFRRGLREIDAAISQHGFIRLCIPFPRRSRPAGRLDSFQLRYCSKVPLSAMAYAISPAAAQQMVDAAVIVEEPIDKFIQRFWRHGQEIYALQPAIVYPHSVGAISDIGERIRHPCDLRSWLARAARNLSNTALRHRHNIARLLTLPSRQPEATPERRLARLIDPDRA